MEARIGELTEEQRGTFISGLEAVGMKFVKYGKTFDYILPRESELRFNSGDYFGTRTITGCDLSRFKPLAVLRRGRGKLSVLSETANCSEQERRVLRNLYDAAHS